MGPTLYKAGYLNLVVHGMFAADKGYVFVVLVCCLLMQGSRTGDGNWVGGLYVSGMCLFTTGFDVCCHGNWAG